MRSVDVLVIGAGPSGSIVSALLNKQGIDVLCVEKERFPRFVIGESLLPNCMNILHEAGFLDAVEAHGFQYKNGAAFSFKDEYRYFDFCDKSSTGYGTTFQVQRGIFDEILINEAIKQGVDVCFEIAVEDLEFLDDYVEVKLSNGDIIRAKYIVDASGYGRVLPRKLNLEVPSTLTPKKAYFTHIQDNINEPLYDRNKILITTHPNFRDVWFWLIPFSNGRCSIGVVGEESRINTGASDEEILKHHVYLAPMLNRLLGNALWDTPVRTISSYSKDVKQLYGDRYILLGNASEFLDPVFSSGVTIAMVSAKLASDVLVKILTNQNVDMKKEYEEPLMFGINSFRTYVEGWYDGKFQDVIYTKIENHKVKRQICSILAGYAWDKNNPYATRSDEALDVLAKFCKK
ncbi:NAD(P)/FAD-dependent oxidoreductase [Helicobacter sp. MIT 99-5507]|uniref:NAD(P)/FAD-dependent oxidoreductase n=1 Tax=Helicobacter sp. MIT 99-5507 TaxID=152489 RepID=UPI000E1F313F|nr:NAD(P)/FAD-dependent oxidoreductase [Helicobacter sp. MIT 99-5507]RDU56712.1 FAD-dependent oxidoreductase [Helicobacter sp. MIT 99-5507]